MLHPIYKVSSFEIVAPYTLRVGFDDGTEQIIDFSPVLHGQMFRPLRDLEVFNQVQLDEEVHTLIWPNGADFDPATLHDWPEHSAELTERAREWKMLPLTEGEWKVLTLDEGADAGIFTVNVPLLNAQIDLLNRAVYPTSGYPPNHPLNEAEIEIAGAAIYLLGTLSRWLAKHGLCSVMAAPKGKEPDVYLEMNEVRDFLDVVEEKGLHTAQN